MLGEIERDIERSKEEEHSIIIKLCSSTDRVQQFVNLFCEEYKDEISRIIGIYP